MHHSNIGVCFKWVTDLVSPAHFSDQGPWPLLSRLSHWLNKWMVGPTFFHRRSSKISLTMTDNRWEVTWNLTCHEMNNVWWSRGFSGPKTTQIATLGYIYFYFYYNKQEGDHPLETCLVTKAFNVMWISLRHSSGPRAVTMRSPKSFLLTHPGH